MGAHHHRRDGQGLPWHLPCLLSEAKTELRSGGFCKLSEEASAVVAVGMTHNRISLDRCCSLKVVSVSLSF